MRLYKLYTNGNTWKYSLNIGRVWFYWKPIIKGRTRFIIQIVSK